MKQNHRYWFAGILVLAAFLRFLSIATRGIQYDDAFSIFLSERSISQIIQGTAADTMPPLYYFLLHIWLAFSHDLWWLRLLSVLLSLGIVVFLYLLVRLLIDEKAALWAAFFAAISPLQYYHAQDIRMYALLAFTQLGYTWFFARIWMNKGTKSIINWLGLVVFGTMAMYSHNLAIFFLIVPDFFLLVKRSWRLLAKFVAAQVLIGLASAPWLFLIPGQVEKIQRAFWTPAPGLVEIIQAFMMSTTGLPLTGIWFGIGLIISLELLVFILLESIRKKASADGLRFFLILTFLPPLLLFIASYLIRPVFVPRGFLASTIAYLGLAAMIVSWQWPRPIGVGIALSLVLAAGIGIPAQANFQDFPRSPFSEAGAYLTDHVSQNDVVIHDNKLSYFPMDYYFPNLPQKFLPDDPGSPNDTFAIPSQQAMNIFPEADLSAALGSHKKVYFVVFQETIADYRAADQKHPQLMRLEAAFHEVSVKVFNDLQVYEFER
jgi:mannosyltransferase